jgi:hypothetical protein
MLAKLDQGDHNIDMLYEFGRLDSLARRTIFFTQQKYLHRTVIPKKFDRVFSFLIDEGDFIPISKKNIVNAGEVSANLEQSIQALIASGEMDNIEGGDMETLGKDYLTYHAAGVTGVFDEDAHFSDETMYQYYFSIQSIEQSFDFQSYRKNNDLAGDNNQIGGAVELFNDPQATQQTLPPTDINITNIRAGFTDVQASPRTPINYTQNR